MNGSETVAQACAWLYTFDLSKLGDAVVTLAAAFAGAWFAFLFERRHKAQEEASGRIAAANRAVYTIFNLWNIQAQIKKEIIDPHRKEPDAWLNMAAHVPSHYGLTRFEAAELSFCIGQDTMVYSALMLEEQRFDLAIKLLEERSRIILNEAFPRLAAAGVGVNDKRDADFIKKAIGTDTVRKLEVLTKAIIDNFDENLSSLKVVHDGLRTAMQRQFPKQKFPKVEFDGAAGVGADGGNAK